MTDPSTAPQNKKDTRILLVDDDPDFLPTLEAVLRSSGYTAATAASGELALQAFSEDRFDLVISDIRMTGMDGLELLKRIKESVSVPVILMTGFSEILETREAHARGADGFLPKPFKRDELVEAIEACLHGARPTETEYFPIPIDDFISGRQIQFDIFIRLPTGRHVKIAHQGVDLPLERIRAYKSKEVTELFLRREDYTRYVGFAASLTQAAGSSRAISPQARLAMVRHTSEIILKQLELSTVEPSFFQTCRTFVETTVEILAGSPDVGPLLERLNNHANHLYAHAVAVSLYSVMMARALGWISPANLFHICMGGLLHDIGKKELDPLLLEKPRRDWSQAEIKAYETHPARGVAILQRIEGIPPEVLQVVKHHHETPQGRGFPAGLRQSQIPPLARLISVANTFCDLILKSPEGPP
ncbi:MAG TPA: response regulator, partial [Bdellovibrionota bacterium]|nr:response regulator [Bdellovibrionota bacterium]